MHPKPSLKVPTYKGGTDHNTESLTKLHSVTNEQQAKNKSVLMY